MKLVCNEINKVLDFFENKVQICVVENQNFFSHLILELKKQITNNEEGIFSLFNENEELNISKSIFLITDLFSFDFNNKKIINLIYSELKNCIINNENNYVIASELKGTILNFLENLIEDFSFPLELDDKLDYENLFKIFNIKIQENYQNHLEKILDFITIAFELKLMKGVIFVNLKTILLPDECYRFYKECFYRKIPLILFENKENYSIIEMEERIIIDSDFCEIY